MVTDRRPSETSYSLTSPELEPLTTPKAFGDRAIRNYEYKPASTIISPPHLTFSPEPQHVLPVTQTNGLTFIPIAPKLQLAADGLLKLGSSASPNNVSPTKIELPDPDSGSTINKEAVHGIKPRKTAMRCPYCSFTSTRERQFRTHISRNHKKAGFQCPNNRLGCETICGRQDNLKVHVERHCKYRTAVPSGATNPSLIAERKERKQMKRKQVKYAEIQLRS